jgi:hypothetical protein
MYCNIVIVRMSNLCYGYVFFDNTIAPFSVEIFKVSPAFHPVSSSISGGIVKRKLSGFQECPETNLRSYILYS